MDVFLNTQKILSKKYKKYEPLFCYLNTSYGLLLAMKLNKVYIEEENLNKVSRRNTRLEIIIHKDESINIIIEKINTNIVFQKNKLKESYCHCGFHLSRFTGFISCCNCKNDSCIVCYFRIFKQEYGEYICYECNITSGKRISNKKMFDLYFKESYDKYICELNDEKLKNIEL